MERRILSLILAVMAAGMSVTANAQKTLLIDRNSLSIDSVRKAFNDSEITSQKSFYADLGMISDGNATQPTKAASQDKGYQGGSLGPTFGGELFDNYFTPTAGVNLSYSYRGVRLSVEGTVGIGHPDELSDNQEKFLEFNGFGDLMIEVAKSKNLCHQVLLGAYATFKTGKNSVKIEEDNGGYFWDKTQAFNFGGGVSLGYIYSPKWSNVYHMIQLRCGLNHKLHTEKDFAESSENTEFSFNGKKAYIQVGVSYKLMFGLGKRHKKVYNTSLRMGKQQINSLVGIK